MNIHQMLVWIVLLPLLGALVNGIAGRSAHKNLVSGVAVGSVVSSFAISVAGLSYLVFTEGAPQIQQDVYEWFTITIGGVDVPIRVRFVMDHLGGIMAVMVSGIATLIHVYSIGYMGEDPGYARFMTYLNLFTASMLLLVLASNLPLMFVGWEGVGLCSYLLIGFWFENASYAAAGRKAFVVNRIGDFGVLIGTFILVSYVTTTVGATDGFEFAVINDNAARIGMGQFSLFSAAGAPVIGGVGVATLASLFIFLGCTGKSAQIPLFTWLPDAMAGPTPVSALIHAATMVTAGVYLCCRLSPVIVQSQVAMSVIAIVGACTALLAASIALVQNEMKKILAYSTVSQLGFMFAAVGMGAFAGGFFHVFTHAFFKACLFLGAGSVMHAVHAHGDADIRYLGGLRKYMPKTHITFAIATCAIAGLPPLAGFFSKDEILLGAATWATTAPSGADVVTAAGLDIGTVGFGTWFSAYFLDGNWTGPWVGWFVFGVLTLAAAMTAFYMFRLYFKTFWGEYKGGHPPAHASHSEAGEEDHEHESVEPHESPDSMTFPLYALAIGAAVVGFLGLPHVQHLAPNLWSEFLTPQHEVYLETHHEALAQGLDEAQALSAAMDAASGVPAGVATLEFNNTIAHAPGWVAWMAMGVGLFVALFGFGLAFFFYYLQDGSIPKSMREAVPWLHRFLMDKWRIDELYNATIVALMKVLGVFAANFDRIVIDGGLTKVTSWFAKGSGWILTRAQSGVIFAYAAMFVVGFGGLAWWFTYPHATLMSDPGVRVVHWAAASGLGYEYRWDVDSDGEWDVDWSEDPNLTHEYEGEQIVGLVAIYESLREQFGPAEVYFSPGGSADEVSERRMGEAWALDPETQERTATLTFALFADREGGVPLWGPFDRDVQVDSEGGFGVLLGADEPIPSESFPVWGENDEEQRRNREAASEQHRRVRQQAWVQVNGDPRVRIDLDPQPGLLLSINGSGLRDDEIADGQLHLAPGAEVPLGITRLTVAARVRGTVEVRNMFGNRARDSRDVTLRLSPGGQLGARAAVTPSHLEGVVR